MLWGVIAIHFNILEGNGLNRAVHVTVWDAHQGSGHAASRDLHREGVCARPKSLGLHLGLDLRLLRRPLLCGSLLGGFLRGCFGHDTLRCE